MNPLHLTDLANKNETLLHVSACVCPVCKTALILIDLNCGRALYIEAPESQSMWHGRNVNIFQRLIGIQTTGPLPVKSEQCTLT